jgi:hypothetical protein
MRLHWMLATLFGLVAVPLGTATCYGADGDLPAQNDLIARHFNYYDDLDLKRYESLEAEFGGAAECSRASMRFALVSSKYVPDSSFLAVTLLSLAGFYPSASHYQCA